MPFEPIKSSSFVPIKEEKKSEIPIEELRLAKLLPDTTYNVEKSGVKEQATIAPQITSSFEPIAQTSFVPSGKKYDYNEFKKDLDRTGSGIRGGMQLVKERIGALVKGDTTNIGRTLFTPTLAYDALARFKTAFKDENYVEAKDVVDFIPDAKTKSFTKNFILNLPKEGAEIAVDFYSDPTIYALGAAGKPIKSIIKLAGANPHIAKAVAKLESSPAGQKAKEILLKPVNELFKYRGNQPKEYIELAERRLLDISKGKEIAKKVGTELSEGLSKGERLRIGQILKGGESASEREAYLREKAAKAREVVTKYGKEATEQNLISEEKFVANMKTYMPRLYRKFEESGKSVGNFLGVKPTRIKGQRFLKRMDLSEEARTLMGEIKEPAYPVAKGIAQVSHDVETSKLFNKVASNPEWTSAIKKEGFIQLPENKKLGSLSGKFVKDSIAKDINEIAPIKGDVNPIVKAVSDLYNAWLPAWKFAKTVANPATHFRNLMSNSIMMDLSGVNHLQQMRLLPKAGKELLQKGKYFKEIEDTGFLGKEFAQVEIKDFLENVSGKTGIFNAISNAVKSKARDLSSIYQSEEQIYKMAQYIHYREIGMPVKRAIQEAEKYQFNYEKVSKFIKWARKSPVGSPFATYVSKAIPRVAEVAVTNPVRVYKYIAMFKAIENQAKDHLGLSDEELNDIKASKRGVNIVLPFTDKDGNYQALDVSYILPWGDLGEQGGVFGLSPSISPFANPISKSVMELAANKSFYTGQPIIKPGVGKIKQIADYFEKNMIPVPTWAGIPGVAGGYSWEKVLSAMSKDEEGNPRADYYGRVRGLPKVLLDVVFGVKINPIDVSLMYKQEHTKMDRDIADIDSHLNYIKKHQGMSQKQKEV